MPEQEFKKVFDALSGYASIFAKSAELSGIVPQITIVAGPCLGASAIAASMSDFTLVVDEVSSLGAFSGSVYDAKDGLDSASGISSAAYAGSTSGLAATVCKNEDEAYSSLKNVVGFPSIKQYGRCA